MSKVSKYFLALLSTLVLVAAACGSGESDESSDAGANSQSGGEQPTIVVTTNILGDVVTELVGDQANVITIMPVGADPHDFQASAQEVNQLLEADALIVNGTNFEEGLLDVIDSAMDSGVPTFEATGAVTLIEFAAGGHDEHGHDDEHGDEHSDEHSDEEGHDEHGDEHKDEHSDEEGHDEHGDDHSDEHSDEEGHDEHGDEHDSHDHDGDDPHFFTDPSRMADVVAAVADFLKDNVEGLDADALDAAADDYVAELTALDSEVEALVDAIPADKRILVTNHEVFGYFADRYGFEVVGAIIPSGSTADGASAGDLAELAELIEAEGVPAIFADTSASTALAETLAAEVGGDIAVVELFTESLGDSDSDGATYLDMVRANANRISDALAS